jgi:hypothetical protein
MWEEIMRHIARHCPSCDGTNLVAGDFMWKLANFWLHRFFPSDAHTILGFSVAAFGCRDCGLISQYVTDERFQKTRPGGAQNLETLLNDRR